MNPSVENRDLIECVSKFDLNRVDKRLTDEIHEAKQLIHENSQAIVRLEAVYASLEGLPDTIVNLDKTITIIGNNLDSMDKNLTDVKESVSQQSAIINKLREENEAQTENIQKIDNKSKIDWALFVTNNFWKIFAVIAAIYVMVKMTLEGK